MALSRKPDIVMVTIDTLRPDWLGLRDGDEAHAPFLAALADESTVFESAVSSSSWTAPATASLLTGTYPTRHGAISGDIPTLVPGRDDTPPVVEIRPIRKKVTLLPTILRDAGWRTVGIAGNYFIGAEFGFNRGFDAYERHPRGTADELVGLACQWLEEDTPSPRFLYLHLNDPHAPYHCRAPVCTRPEEGPPDARAAYASEIRFTDSALDTLVQAARRSSLSRGRETIFVFASDHGEGFGEHGFRGHPFILFSEVNDVLLMVHAPGLGVGQRRVQTTVSLVDVVPTLLDLTDTPAPGTLDGRSLAPLLGGEGTFASRQVYAHRARFSPAEEHVWSVIDGDYKLIVDSGRLRLFDRASDRREASDLAFEHTAQAQDMKDDLDRFAATAEWADNEPRRLDPGGVEELRTLGYVAH